MGSVTKVFQVYLSDTEPLTIEVTIVTKLFKEPEAVVVFKHSRLNCVGDSRLVKRK